MIVSRISTTFLIILCYLTNLNNARKNFSVKEIFTSECSGKSFYNVSLTAYYADYSGLNWKRVQLDARGKKLRNLEDFLDDRTDYVTLAMDEKLKIPYGTAVCSPELNRHFGRRIKLQVRDDSPELFGKRFTRAEICVRSEADSYDQVVNQQITLVF